MKSFKVLLLAAIFLCSSVVIAGACESHSKTSTTKASACEKKSETSSAQAGGCGNKFETSTTQTANGNTKISNKKAVFNVSGMDAGCCASKVQSALTSAEGVKSCDVNMKTGKCEVEFNDQQTSAENLLTTVDKCGFKASLANVETLEPAQKATSNKDEAITQKAVLNVSGMTCGGCASEVKSALTKVNGVKDCKVSWKEGKAEVEFSGDPAKAGDLVKAVNKTGFKASLANVESLEPMDDGEDTNDSEDADYDSEDKEMVVKDNQTFKATSYACEDCGFRQAKAGSCPVHDSKLIKVGERHTFVCEECDYAQAKAGSCPGHKTALVEYSIEYECPACHMDYAEAGMCSMCKKQLQMVTDKPVAPGKQMTNKEKATY